MPALPGSCSLPPCSTGPSANFIIIQNIPKLVVCCWLNGVPSPRLALISVAAYTVLWLWSWGVKISFSPPAPSSLLTLGVGVSWRQKIIFFFGAESTQWPEAVSGRRQVVTPRGHEQEAAWRSLPFGLESIQTTRGRKCLATDHFSKAHYRRGANGGLAPSLPISSDCGRPSEISIARAFSLWWYSGNNFLFLKSFLAILSPWQLLKIC